MSSELKVKAEKLRERLLSNTEKEESLEINQIDDLENWAQDFPSQIPLRGQ